MVDDKVDSWRLAQRRRKLAWTRFLRRVGVFFFVLVLLIPLWPVIRWLEYEQRDRLLGFLCFAFLFSPMVFPLIPRCILPLIYAFCTFGLALGAAYCGDMGADGHMLIAGFLILTSIMSGVLAWLLTGLVIGNRRGRED